MLTNVRNAVITKVCLALSVGMVLAVAARASYIDRQYLLGDDTDNGEQPMENMDIASNYDNYNTVDSQYITLPGPLYYAYHDIYSSRAESASGPKYTNVGTGGAINRPGVTAATAWGVNLNGTDNYLYRDGLFSSAADGNGDGGFGYPQHADNELLYYDMNTNDRVINYNNIVARYIEGWARPTNSAAAGRQTIVADTDQIQIFISASDGMGKEYWGLAHGPVNSGGTNNEITTSTTEVTYNTWHHLMLLTVPANDGILYVDGVAVAVETQNIVFPAADSNLNYVMGAGVDKASEFFQGQLDDWNIGTFGMSAAGTQQKTGSSGADLPGEDFGAFNLGVDNQYIALQLAGKDPGDVNLDGNLNQADIDMFKQSWLTTKTVNNVVVGDLTTRLNGDLNFDGRINLDDAIVLRDALLNAGSGATLDLSSLVPEPASVSLAVLGLLSLIGVRRRRD